MHKLYIIGDNGLVRKDEIAAVVRLPDLEEDPDTEFWEFTLKNGQKVVLDSTPDGTGSVDIYNQVWSMDE